MNPAPARAFWLRQPGVGEIRAQPLATPAADEVLVRSLYSGISRGTETLVFRGEVPAGERRRMRAPFQDGEFPAPVKYGYCSVGVVEIGPAELLDRVVFCLYPHQSRYVVPAAAVLPVPDGVPPARALLAANLETAINALWDAPPLVGDRIAVVGAGLLGCLVAWLAARVPGVRVQLVDVRVERAPLAAALGAGFALAGDADDDCDLVVHTSASGEGLALALSLAAFEATVLELSWYGNRQVSLPLGEGFHAGRLRLRSSQVGAVADARRARRSHRERLALALSLLTAPELDVLLSGEDPFEDLPALMQRLASGESDALCHRLRYD